MLIYSFHKKAREYKLYVDNKNKWDIIVDEVLTQRKLDATEVIGYLCNVAHDGSDNV